MNNILSDPTKVVSESNALQTPPATTRRKTISGKILVDPTLEVAEEAIFNMMRLTCFQKCSLKIINRTDLDTCIWLVKEGMPISYRFLYKISK